MTLRKGLWIASLSLSFFTFGSVSKGESGTAEAVKVDPVIINYEQLYELPTSMRAAYIRAVRLALVEIEEDQRKEGTWTSWLSFFPEAMAADDVSNQCIYAGWIGTFSAPVDGHRYCHAPPEALTGCAEGEIKCKPAIFGDNLCVKRNTYATSSCDAKAPASTEVAKSYLSDPNFKKDWDQLASAIDNICAITTRQQSPCAKIEKRLDAVKKRDPIPVAVRPTINTASMVPPTPTDVTTQSIGQSNGPSTGRHPRRGNAASESSSTATAPSAPNPPPAVASSANGGQSAAKTPCKKDRDKGGVEWGTCHAFCALCTLDRLSAKSNFRTSANWVVFLSAVDRVCNPGVTESGQKQPVITNPTQLFGETLKGGDTRFDFNLALKYGFCDEEKYLPYSAKEPPQPLAQAIKQGLDANKKGTSAAFTNQFGISFDNLKNLYCPANKSSDSYETRLQTLKPQIGSTAGGQKFLECATESLKLAKSLNGPGGPACQVKGTTAAGGQSIDPHDLQTALSEHLPIAVDIIGTDPSKKHCVTVTDFKNNQFDIINSHGEGTDFSLYSNEPIKVPKDDKDRKIVGYSYLECRGIANASSPSDSSSSPSSSGRHHHGVH